MTPKEMDHVTEVLIQALRVFPELGDGTITVDDATAGRATLRWTDERRAPATMPLIIDPQVKIPGKGIPEFTLKLDGVAHTFDLDHDGAPCAPLPPSTALAPASVGTTALQHGPTTQTGSCPVRKWNSATGRSCRQRQHGSRSITTFCRARLSATSGRTTEISPHVWTMASRWGRRKPAAASLGLGAGAAFMLPEHHARPARPSSRRRSPVDRRSRPGHCDHAAK
jgi:hypothetical protein